MLTNSMNAKGKKQRERERRKKQYGETNAFMEIHRYGTVRTGTYVSRYTEPGRRIRIRGCVNKPYRTGNVYKSI